MVAPAQRRLTGHGAGGASLGQPLPPLRPARPPRSKGPDDLDRALLRESGRGLEHHCDPVPERLPHPSAEALNMVRISRRISVFLWLRSGQVRGPIQDADA